LWLFDCSLASLLSRSAARLIQLGGRKRGKWVEYELRNGMRKSEATRNATVSAKRESDEQKETEDKKKGYESAKNAEQEREKTN
jgi:hypothetical protein